MHRADLMPVSRPLAPTRARRAFPGVAVAALASWLALARALPAAAERDTTLTLPGLAAPVRLLTDVYGIPHLEARNISDLYFAWGFVGARDRLWQMEHGRRSASGRLWEWFGNRSLRADGGAQLFELADRAARIWARDRNDPQVSVALSRFAEGVNAYLALCRSGQRPWPREFLRLGKYPEDWHPADCVLFLLAQGVVLDFAVPEIAEADSLRLHGAAWLEHRRRFESDWTYSTIPDSVAEQRYGRAPHPRLPGRPFPGGTRTGWRFPGLPTERDRELGASDIFAVGPGRSASGEPLLANDVHLSLTAPAPFHAIHVTVADTVDAAGAWVPGLPIVVSGRNRRAAWGITSLGADVVDVYADTLSADGRSVRWRGTWAPIREADFTMRFHLLGIPLPTFGQKRRYTPHGPIVDFDRKRRIAVSLRWTALEGEPSLRGLIGLERSADVGEVVRHVKTLITPTLNVMAADVEGRVRYQTVGAVPHRGFDPGFGVLPGDGRHEWQGLIPPDSMPAWDLPARGFATNGNNLPIGAPYPEAFPRYDWIHDRAARMAQRLAGDSEVTLDDARSVQNDIYSRAAERFVPRLLRCADSLGSALSDTARAALDTLRAWDYRCIRDRTAPTLFRAWLGTYLRRSGLGDVPALAVAALDGRAPEALRDPVRGTPERAAVAAVEALNASLVDLRRLLGPNPRTWVWGRAHRARFVHALAWRDPAFQPPTLGMDGDNSSPSVGGSRLPRDVLVTHGPTWRHVVDLASPDSSLAVVPPGNGGGPEHDRDHLQRWASHRYVPLYLSWECAEAARESEWRLEPGPSRHR